MNARQIIDQYEEALNEQGEITIGTLSYSPAYVLKNVDEIAYREGLNNYADMLLSDLEEDSEEYNEMQEAINDL